MRVLSHHLHVRLVVLLIAVIWVAFLSTAHQVFVREHKEVKLAAAEAAAARNASLHRVEAAAAAHNDSSRKVMVTGRKYDKSNSVRKHEVVKEAAAEAAAAAHNDSLSRVMVAGREYDKNNSDIVLGDHQVFVREHKEVKLAAAEAAAARNASLHRVEAAAAAHNDSSRKVMVTGRKYDKSNSVRKHEVVKEAAAEAAAAAHNDSLSRVMVAGREYDKNNSDIVLGDPCANCRVDRVNVLHNATGPQCMSVKCSHRFAQAYYHGIHDCAVYYLQVVLSLKALRHSQVTLLFNSQGGHMTIVSTLIDRLIKPDHQLKTTLKHQPRGVCKTHLSDTKQSFSEYSCKRCFVQEMKQAATRKHGLPRQQGILFISRKSTRRITDEKVLVRRLTEIADSWGLPFRIYHGRENFLATVHLFLSSNIIVGYHGAGFINTVFCDRAHVIEITTFKYPTNNSKYPRRIWRSNKPGVSSWMTNSTLAWQILAVEHDRLVPRPPRDHPRGASFDWDHLVKETSVSLGRSNIKRITDMVEMTLKRQVL